jgi:hypothetical protein
MGEKPWSTQFNTIHWRHEICQVGMPFVHNLLIKTPIGLFKSCRGMLGLQLCLLHLGRFSSKFWSYNRSNRATWNSFAWTRRPRAPAAWHRRATPRAPAVGPSGPGRRGAHPPLRPSPLAPRTHGPPAPTMSPPHQPRLRRTLPHARRHVATMPSWLTSKPPLLASTSYKMQDPISHVSHGRTAAPPWPSTPNSCAHSFS